MGDILGNGVSALLAFQRSLATVSHNISNVNTPGYTRQRTDLSTLPPQFTGAGYIGTGVQVTGIQRVYDSFLNRQVTTNTAAESQLSQFHQLASQVDNLLGSQGAGLNASLQSFFSALQDVANTPTSTAVRQTFLSSAQSLVQTFHTLSGQLNSLNDNVNQSLTNNAADITSLAQGIAKLNREIVNAQGAGSGITPNDLLDQRGALLNKLAKLVGVTTIQEGNGALDVYIGSGQALVVGLKSATVATANNTTDPSHKDLTLSFGGGAPVAITAQISGGTVGGMLQFRKEVLDPAFNGLGRLAVGLAQTFNAQHRLGMDLKGRMGGDFFVAPQPQVLPAPGNAGTVSSVSVADPSKLTTSDYRLSYNGSAWALTRLSDGQNVTLSGSGTAASPFTADGLSIVVGPGAAAGDQYLIQPTRTGAAQIGLAVTEPDRIAAAAPVRIDPAVDSTGTTTNTGTGAFGAVTATAAAALPLSSDITFTYDAATKTFSYSGGASFAYDPSTDSGKTFSAAGIQFTVTGTPATGDKFIMSNNTAGIGDNRNAVLLGQLQSKPLLVGGTASYSDTYGQLVADVGSKTQQADVAQQAQAALLQQAQQAQSAVSGVNLDEEAAKMIRFQQAYQAAARVITVSDTIFQTLLNAVR